MYAGKEIKDHQEYLRSVYAKNGDFSADGILARLVEAVALTASPFEADRDDGFLKAISWLFAFCDKASIDLQTSFIGQYPNICPLCLNDICVCEQTNRLPNTRARHFAGSREETLRYYANKLLNKRNSEAFGFDRANRILSSIYPVNAARWNVNRFYFPAKLLREVGKTANGFRRYKLAGLSDSAPGAKKALQEGTVDLFAWIIVYWGMLLSPNDLDGRFRKRYGLGCPHCGQRPCTCSSDKRLGNRAEFIAINLIDQSPELIEELQAKFSEYKQTLKASLSEHPELQQELLANLPEAGKASAKTISSFLWGVLDKVDRLASTGDKIVKIHENTARFLEFIEKTIGNS